MPKEVKVAYPSLIGHWRRRGGLSVRLRPTGVKGIPDFLLVHPVCGVVLCEIKSVSQGLDDIGLDLIQAQTLGQIIAAGGQACVLALNLNIRQWAGFSGAGLEAKLRAGGLTWNQGVVSEAVTPEFVRLVSRGLS